MKDADESELLPRETFDGLMKRCVRVVWNEDPGDKEKRGKIWTGVLTRDDGEFIELDSEGKLSYINKKFIVAMSELPNPTW